VGGPTVPTEPLTPCCRPPVAAADTTALARTGCRRWVLAGRPRAAPRRPRARAMLAPPLSGRCGPVRRDHGRTPPGRRAAAPSGAIRRGRRGPHRCRPATMPARGARGRPRRPHSGHGRARSTGAPSGAGAAGRARRARRRCPQPPGKRGPPAGQWSAAGRSRAVGRARRRAQPGGRRWRGRPRALDRGAAAGLVPGRAGPPRDPRRCATAAPPSGTAAISGGGAAPRAWGRSVWRSRMAPHVPALLLARSPATAPHHL
jgi:hypothetical protein